MISSSTYSTFYRLRIKHVFDDFRHFREERHAYTHSVCGHESQRSSWWYKLSRVCRWWRYLILESPCHLDLHLVCIYGVPVADMLAHSPSLPLSICYISEFYGMPKMTREDEEGALLAISHRHRVRRIALCTQIGQLGKFISAIEGEFPILERLCLEQADERSDQADDGRGEANEDLAGGLIPPLTFQAPNLRHLHLSGVALLAPKRSPLLATIRGLTFLWLGDSLGYPLTLPHDALLRQLSIIPQLEWLGIEFDDAYSPQWRAGHAFDVGDSALKMPVTFPNLCFFYFRGRSAYLASIISAIDAPVLTTFHVQTFDCRHIATILWPFQSMELSQRLPFKTFSLSFSMDDVQLKANPNRRLWECPLLMRIRCRALNLKVSSAVHILHALTPSLSAVEILKITQMTGFQSSPEHDFASHTQCHTLLKSLRNVKRLDVTTDTLRGFPQYLHSENGDSPMEILPHLEKLYLCGKSDGGQLRRFVEERKAAGHPVRVIDGRCWER